MSQFFFKGELIMTREYKTLNELFDYVKAKFGSREIFFTKNVKKKKFEGITFNDAYMAAENLGIMLSQLGVEPGDRVGLMADNKKEWGIADMAVLMNGACNVPRGTDSTEQDVEYILNHCEAKVSFFDNKEFYDSMAKTVDKTSVDKVIIMDPAFKKSADEKVLSMTELLEQGKGLRDSKLDQLKKRATNTKPDDLFTMIYTSGTTGQPKGVMLSHANMIYNVKYVPEMVGISQPERFLSILPVWHIFERAVDYVALAFGCGIYYTNIRDLRDDFALVKPTFMGSAPRLWEKIYAGIKAKIENAEPIKKALFEAAYEINRIWRKGLDYLQGNELKVKPETDIEKIGRTAWALFTTVNLFAPAKILDAVVFGQLRNAMGGSMKGTMSGGGALPPHVDEFFNCIGLPVLEGYGMTETAPIISVRTIDHIVQGSVGFPPIGTQVKVLNDKGQEVADGEIGVIHIKGPQVMKGYYKNEEATKKVLKSGWMNTGDLGFRSLNGTISVRGRVKETIVLLGGENVEPVPIENKLLEEELVNQIMIVGQDKKTLSALIWPDKDALAKSEIKLKDGEDLNKRKDLRNLYVPLIKEKVSSKNGFKSFERLTDFRFLPKEMEVGDEMTSTFKMRRNIIADKYKGLIEEMYS